jgi:uridine phosphorylase
LSREISVSDKTIFAVGEKGLMSENFHPKDIPLINNKQFKHPSVFTPESLLREARRQKSTPMGKLPDICILDPDGDIVRNLLAQKKARINPYWACYHTELLNFSHEEMEFGIIGRAVGAPFAVLVAEEVFASGCSLLISITSAGQILPVRNPPYFVLIDQALRDEGTSYHYLPPSKYSKPSEELLHMMEEVFETPGMVIEQGASWTTDAPFREIEKAIDYCKAEGILAVEMEAAALYAFGEARRKPVICIAHVTNQMGSGNRDFEKGEADGSKEALNLISTIARVWKKHNIKGG